MNKVALITGGAKRLGAEMARALHEDGFNVAIHYRQSKDEAKALAKKFNDARPDSAIIIKGDLNKFSSYKKIINVVNKKWKQLDVLVNNASEYFPTPLEKTTEKEWHRLITSNTKAPYFLIQAAAPLLKKSKGCVVNLSDMNTFNHKPGYSVYCIAKSGVNVITHMLSKELKSHVRVNAIAPGTTIPPQGNAKPQIDLAKVHAVIDALRSLVKGDATGKIICMS